jgi:hypothetical protein
VWQSCNVGGVENDFALESFPCWAAVFPGHLLELEVVLHRHAEACIPVFWRRKEYIKGWGARNISSTRQSQAYCYKAWHTAPLLRRC